MAKFRLLVTTAIAATLTAGVAAHAGLITSETIAAAVPVPEPADLKPLKAEYRRLLELRERVRAAEEAALRRLPRPSTSFSLHMQ